MVTMKNTQLSETHANGNDYHKMMIDLTWFVDDGIEEVLVELEDDEIVINLLGSTASFSFTDMASEIVFKQEYPYSLVVHYVQVQETSQSYQPLPNNPQYEEDPDKPGEPLHEPFDGSNEVFNPQSPGVLEAIAKIKRERKL